MPLRLLPPFHRRTVRDRNDVAPTARARRHRRTRAIPVLRKHHVSVLRDLLDAAVLRAAHAPRQAGRLLRLARHIWVADTVDGGASAWLRRPNADGKEIPRYRERLGEELPWDWPQASSLAELEGKQEQEALPVWCHCRGIELRLRRGDYASREREQLPWFVDPTTDRLLAGFDACDSCRLQVGCDIVELANIAQADGGALPKTTAELQAAVDAGDPAVGTLAYYRSSPDVRRYFCRVCSASAFYACDDRPEIVDVAVGLLEAPDGARAEGLLSWGLGDTPGWVDDTKRRLARRADEESAGRCRGVLDCERLPEELEKA